MKNPPNGSHQAVGCHSFLSIFIVLPSFRVGESNVGFREFSAKTDCKWSNVISVDVDDLFEGHNKLLKINLIHNSEQYLQDISETRPEQIDGDLVVKQLRQSNSCFNFDSDVLAVE